jgi:3,4-dihydroxy 2-butanone 4-phosphate synthase/GTP cyclohydrolase II
MSLGTASEAIAALRDGKPVVVYSDDSASPDAHLVLAAHFATPALLAWIIRSTTGLVYAAMTDDVADRLDLPFMVVDPRAPRAPAFTVTVDAASCSSTGAGASDRARTLRVLADPASPPESLRRPGHVLPVRAGPGFSEAAVWLLLLAGLPPVAAAAAPVGADGEPLALAAVLALGLPAVPFSALRAAPPALPPPAPRVVFRIETTVSTQTRPLRIRAYSDRRTGAEHVALFWDPPPARDAFVRVHSECLTGETFGSTKCECLPQLQLALARTREEGGVVIYMRGHEGRGIGLINKLRAYDLQAHGMDTVDANPELGLPVDARDYTAAADILRDLGVESLRLLTNNQDKAEGLARCGLEVEQVPHNAGACVDNLSYRRTKRVKLGHTISVHPGNTISVHPVEEVFG